jgi:ubiquinol-cytochrome c reductase cytochrome c subunit
VRLITRKISARLSTRRRSRYAAPAVLIVGLLASAGLYTALAPANANKTSDDAATIAKGRSLFQVSCASCHGQNAEGIQTERGNNFGPSLVGVGAAAVDFQVGTGRMPMAQPGAQAAQRKVLMGPDEIEALGAYVQSLGPGPAVPDSELYKASTDTADIVRGGQFFRTNCTACHNFAGSGGALPGGKYAPNLRGVSPKYIYEALLTGPQQMPVFSDGVLSPEDKKDIISYLKKTEETPSYGGFTLGSIGPVSEGMFAWLVGIGGLVCVGIWITAGNTRVKKTQKGDGA